MEWSRDLGWGEGFKCGLFVSQSSHGSRQAAIIFSPNDTHVKMNTAAMFLFSVIENGAYTSNE